MMRERLLHMKKLLSADGSVWVHLDDVEVHRMRLLLDEVFGSQNYIAEIIWEKAYAPSNNASGIPMVTNSILVYRRSEAFNRNKLIRSAAMDARYLNPDGDKRGRLEELRKEGAPEISTSLGVNAIVRLMAAAQTNSNAQTWCVPGPKRRARAAQVPVKPRGIPVLDRRLIAISRGWLGGACVDCE